MKRTVMVVLAVLLTTCALCAVGCGLMIPERRVEGLERRVEKLEESLRPRIEGTWMKSTDTRAITFHDDGTVTTTYDTTEGRRWTREGNRVMFTGLRGEHCEVVFLPGGDTMVMGTRLWLRAPTRE